MKVTVIPYAPKAIQQHKLKMGPHGVHGPVEVPFDIDFFGKVYHQLWIAGYGCLLFEELKHLSGLSNITKLPRDDGKETEIGPAFCPLWEAMQAGACETDMAYEVQDRAIGIQWNDVAISGAVYMKNSFQAWIYSNGVMEAYYDKIYVRGINDESSLLNGVIGAIDHTRKRGVTVSDLIGTGSVEKVALRFEPEESDFIDQGTQSKPVVDPLEALTPKEVKIADGDIVERTVYIPLNAGGADLKIRRIES